MILYAIEVNGVTTSFEPSIVTIWNNKQDATDAMNQYIENCKEAGVEQAYRIKEINTDNKCVYDYQDN